MLIADYLDRSTPCKQLIIWIDLHNVNSGLFGWIFTLSAADHFRLEFFYLKSHFIQIIPGNKKVNINNYV